MTNKISAEVVERTWHQLAETPSSQAPKMANHMKDEQPYVMMYLLAVGDALFDRHEVEILLYVGMAMWRMMRQSEGRLQTVARQTLDEAEEANYDLIEQLAEDGDQDLVAAMQALVETYPEPEVLRYAVEAIMEDEDEEEPGIEDENRGLAFIHLKTVLDAMIMSLEEPHQDLH